MFRRFSCSAFLALVFTGGCGPAQHDAPADACTPGLIQSCSGARACAGKKACLGSPAYWSACQCDSAPDAGIPQPAVPELGGACRQTADCAIAATCLLPTSTQLFGGAPPDGICVATCKADADCSAFSNAVCVDMLSAGTDAGAGGASASSGLCFERCKLGDSPAVKCHAGARVACAPIGQAGTTDGFCRPVCASDADCASGSCDPKRGVCVTTPIADRTFGLACEPSAAEGGAGGATSNESDAGAGGVENDAGASSSTSNVVCDGQCVTLNGSSSVCSRRCVFGNTSECAPASGGQRRGACAFVTPGGSIGDLGYCAELCDCKDDCIDPTFTCDAFDDKNLENAFGRKGACTPPDIQAKHPLACAG